MACRLRLLNEILPVHSLLFVKSIPMIRLDDSKPSFLKAAVTNGYYDAAEIIAGVSCFSITAAPPSATQSPTMASRKRNTEIKKIENKKARNVCFSKRRQGLFKIAQKYHHISKSHIAVLVFSSSGKSYVDGSPSFDPIVRKFLQTQSSGSDSESTTITDPSVSDSVSNAVIGEGTAARLREWVESMKVEEYESLEELKAMKKTIEEIKEKVIHGFVDSLVMRGV